jgi:hypothetical protein
VPPFPSFFVAVLSSPPRFSLVSTSPSAGISTLFVLYRIQFLISVHSCCTTAAACGVFNYAFCRARAGILVHISPVHGISNGNGNPFIYSYKGSRHSPPTVQMNTTFNGSRREIACPRPRPPYVASRPSREMLGLCNSLHNVLTFQAV